MNHDPRDKVAYQIAIAALGVALIAAVAGISWMSFAGCGCDTTAASIEVPIGVWIVPAALAGVLVGILLPFRSYKPLKERRQKKVEPHTPWRFGAAFLLVALVVAAVIGVRENEVLFVPAAAIAGLLLGLPIPSPAQGD